MEGFGTRLRQARTALHMTQDDLAARLHVTRQTVSGWETGRTEPDLDTLDTLAAVLATTPDALLGRAPADSKHASPANGRPTDGRPCPGGVHAWRPAAVLAGMGVFLLALHCWADTAYLAPYTMRTYQILPRILGILLVRTPGIWLLAAALARLISARPLPRPVRAGVRGSALAALGLYLVSGAACAALFLAHLTLGVRTDYAPYFTPVLWLHMRPAVLGLLAWAVCLALHLTRRPAGPGAAPRRPLR